MKGLISFHPVDLELFDRFITPLIAGNKINPEAYLNDAIRLRENLYRAGAIIRGIEHRMASAGPPRAERGAPLWKRVKTRLDAMEHPEDELSEILRQEIEPDLHLSGRPFFVTEASAARVAEIVSEYRKAQDEDQIEALVREQLIRIDRRLAGEVEPLAGEALSNDFNYRRELLDRMRALYDLVRTARQGGEWPDRHDRRIQAIRVVERELPWRALAIHASAVPFWHATDVDGLETVCRSAGIAPPDCLVPAWRLLADACGEFPGIREHLRTELAEDRLVGAYVSPEEIPDLLDFLNVSGGRIIQEAMRYGAGPACTLLLRKIRECATYARTRGAGYLEAAGLAPPDRAM